MTCLENCPDFQRTSVIGGFNMAYLVLFLFFVFAGKEKVLVIATHKVNWLDSQVFFCIIFITLDQSGEWFQPVF